MEGNIITLRCGISITPNQDKAIDEILSALITKGPARFVLLTDKTGQIVSVCGERGKADLVAMGSLAAADLAASEEIARLTGEYQENQMILREGSKYHTTIYEAGPNLILMMQVSCETPLGWMRYLVRTASKEIVEVISTTPTDMTENVLDFRNLDMGNLVDDAINEAWLG
jgi:predicted regulator of Ras-like GTPase activity (Roadblock/LC7/MglB family)